MDEAMDSEHQSEETSGAAMQADSEVAGQAGSSGGGAGPSGAGTAGPSWAAEAGPSWAGVAGPSWAGASGLSGVPRYERRRNKEDYWEYRRKRKNRNTGEVAAKRQKRLDDGSAVAHLLHGMSVRGPDDDDAARRSLFDHERLVWWTAHNWQTQSGLGAKPTVYKSVPEPIAVDPPTEPVNFNREDAENAAAVAPRTVPRSSGRSSLKPMALDGGRSNQLTARDHKAPVPPFAGKTSRIACGLRARLSRMNKQRRLAVSESDVDVEHAKEEFEQFLLFKDKKSEVSSDSDSSYSSLFDSITDSSDSSTEKQSVLGESDSDESCMG